MGHGSIRFGQRSNGILVNLATSRAPHWKCGAFLSSGPFLVIYVTHRDRRMLSADCGSVAPSLWSSLIFESTAVHTNSRNPHRALKRSWQHERERFNTDIFPIARYT